MNRIINYLPLFLSLLFMPLYGHAKGAQFLIQHERSTLCIAPSKGANNKNKSVKLVFKRDCDASFKNTFTLLPNGLIQHVASKRCVRPKGRPHRVRKDTPMLLSSDCSNSAFAFRVGNSVLQHKLSDFCAHPANGRQSPKENTLLSLNRDCKKSTAMFIYPPVVQDDDGDGIPNQADQCPLTLPAEINLVDATGCAPSQKDADEDGVNDASDKCPQTESGVEVDATGCRVAKDTDEDGIQDHLDQCPDKRGLRKIGGCPALFDDGDADGIRDAVDQCPFTKQRDGVDSDGCAVTDSLDEDFDGVMDGKDSCLFTNASIGVVSPQGCTGNQLFDLDRDGVLDGEDLCPIEFGDVDRNGCSRFIGRFDNDGDGVMNHLDLCPHTPEPFVELFDIAEDGCFESFVERDVLGDRDGDSVFNRKDRCSETPLGEIANSDGCSASQADTDSDGIRNILDQCPNTLPELEIDDIGCALPFQDRDDDLIENDKDQCPSRAGPIAFGGCPSAFNDSDGDGILNPLDKCPATKVRLVFVADGCSIDDEQDDDGDGVNNGNDLCQLTPSTAKVLANGCASPEQLEDRDNDSVLDVMDLCPDEFGSVNLNGCSTTPGTFDFDQDGVLDSVDQCQHTPRSFRNSLSANGCLVEFLREDFGDDDGDRIPNRNDQCPNTPLTEVVNSSGCDSTRTDVDNDGVFDHIDQCPFSPQGRPVGDTGCPLPDEDQDGVPDVTDQCPGTPARRPVDTVGCQNTIVPDILGQRDLIFDSVPNILGITINDLILNTTNTLGMKIDIEQQPDGFFRIVTQDQRIEFFPPNGDPQGEFFFTLFVSNSQGDRSDSFDLRVQIGTASINKASVFVHDTASIEASGITLLEVFDTLAAEGDTGNGIELFRQFWDGQRSQSAIGSDINCGPINGFPVECDRRESNVALLDDDQLLQEIQKYKTLAAVNRIDLRHDWLDCGMHRMSFALDNSIGRNFMIVESTAPNPTPGDIRGCEPVISFWQSLSAMAPSDRGDALRRFFITGEVTGKPIIAVSNLSKEKGQVRTNQFISPTWMLREHELEMQCEPACKVIARPVRVDENPFGALFNASLPGTSSPLANIAEDFQLEFPTLLDPLLSQSIIALSNPVPERFNHGQSHASGRSASESDYNFHFNGDVTSTFGERLTDQLNDAVDARGNPLTASQILARATAMTCGGCHQPGRFGLLTANSIGAFRLSDGSIVDSWPSALGFVHVSESRSISPALRDVFIPERIVAFDKVLKELGINGAPTPIPTATPIVAPTPTPRPIITRAPTPLPIPVPVLTPVPTPLPLFTPAPAPGLTPTPRPRPF